LALTTNVSIGWSSAIGTRIDFGHRGARSRSERLGRTGGAHCPACDVAVAEVRVDEKDRFAPALSPHSKAQAFFVRSCVSCVRDFVPAT
jgi:hypothetical protein